MLILQIDTCFYLIFTSEIKNKNMIQKIIGSVTSLLETKDREPLL